MRFRYAYARAEKPGLEMNMIAMVDVMFNLLLFTILSTSYIQQSAMEVQLPQAKSSPGVNQQTVTVELTRDDKIFIQNHEVDLVGLRNQLEKIYTSPEVDRQLLVRADEDARHGHVVAILDMARQLGVKSLNIATLPSVHP